MSRFQAHERHLIPFFLFLLALMAGFCQPAFARAPVQAKEGILLVAFGTSVPEGMAAFKKIDASYKAAFPGTPIKWAFTSQIIRKKLASRGEPVGSIGQGLEQLAKDGVKVVRVQSLHVMAGEEFAALARSLLVWTQKHPGAFNALYLGRPLLESRADAENAARAVTGSLASMRAPGEAIVLMGHGQEHGRAGLAFEGVRSAFRDADPLVFMATVEGERDFDDLVKELKSHNIKKVVLAPLMVVAGDHARNDLGGEEPDSWASRLKKAGYDVEVSLKGMGEMPGIDNIFISHTKSSGDDLTKEPKKP